MEKEIIEIRKLYLVQFEKFETKVFLSLLAAVLSLFLLYFKTLNETIGIITIFMAILLILSDFLIQSWRKSKFNDLIRDCGGHPHELIL